MSRSRYKKLYYVPGLISLILVPLLFAYLGKEKLQALDVRGIEIIFWHPNLSDLIPFPERNYKQYVLTGDPTIDSNTIEQAEIQIKDIYVLKDTTNGVQMTFQDSVNYGAFISIINRLNKNDIILFMPYKNNLWILYPSPPKYTEWEKPISTECILCDDIVIVSPAVAQLTVIEQLRSTLSTYSSAIEKLWPSLALLFILIILTIAQIIRQFNPTTYTSVSTKTDN